MQTSQLPYLDEHTAVIEADAQRIWPVLAEAVERAYSGPLMTVYARIVGSDIRTASGPRPLTDGSTMPGFRVATATVGAEMALRGRHRFSDYALIFRLEPVAPGRSRLTAQTRAAFPGPAGAVYRMLVINSGGHAVGVRRLLAGIKRRSEQ